MQIFCCGVFRTRLKCPEYLGLFVSNSQDALIRFGDVAFCFMFPQWFIGCLISKNLVLCLYPLWTFPISPLSFWFFGFFVCKFSQRYLLLLDVWLQWTWNWKVYLGFILRTPVSFLSETCSVRVCFVFWRLRFILDYVALSVSLITP